MEKLSQRLKAFSLELAEEKTRILPIGRYKGTKEDFDFLGFTFYNTKTREGKYRLGVRTSKKKLKAKKRAAKAWLKAQGNKPVSVCLARGTGDGRRPPGIGVQPQMPNNPKLL